MQIQRSLSNVAKEVENNEDAVLVKVFPTVRPAEVTASTKPRMVLAE